MIDWRRKAEQLARFVDDGHPETIRLAMGIKSLLELEQMERDAFIAWHFFQGKKKDRQETYQKHIEAVGIANKVSDYLDRIG